MTILRATVSWSAATAFAAATTVLGASQRIQDRWSDLAQTDPA